MEDREVEAFIEEFGQAADAVLAARDQEPTAAMRDLDERKRAAKHVEELMYVLAEATTRARPQFVARVVAPNRECGGLQWTGLMPSRVLYLRANPDTGQFLWSLQKADIIEGRSTLPTPRLHAVDARKVTGAEITELILALTRQDSWMRGEIPGVSLQGEPTG